MADFGLTSAGFNKKQFADVKSDIENSLVSSLGKINLTPPSVFAQVVAIFAERESIMWELMEAIYNSMYPDTAEGYSLDGACSFTGVLRLNATATRVLCQLTAVNYTTITADSEVLVENTSNIFLLDEEITITNEKCYSILLEVTSNTQTSYSITVNNNQITYNVIEGDDVTAIASKLTDAINSAELDLIVYSKDSNITITASNIIEVFSCFVSDEIQILSCVNNAYFTAKTLGNIPAPSFAVNIIQTPIQGWISVNNLTAGIIGRNLETDIELRERRRLSLRLSGSGTIEAIKARLLNLLGVTSVNIVENNTTEIDSDGRPPHSFEALVLGGDDLSIANIIWQAKPAGIQTYGNTEAQALDSNNKPQIIRFSRSTKLFIYVNITITKSNNFVDESINTIKNSIATKINKLGVNTDVIYQSLFASIYAVEGITSADVKIGGTLDESVVPNLLSQNIIVGAAQIAITDISKITVIIV